MISKLYLKKYFQFRHYIFPFWKKAVLILLLSVITTILGLINPYLAKLIIDKAYGHRDMKLFIILIAISGIIFVLDGIIKGIVQYLNRYIKLRIIFKLNREILKKLEVLSYIFFQNTSTGQHLYKINYDIERVADFITELLTQVILLILKSLFILIIVLYLNWKMALFTLALTPFLYLVSYYFTKRLREGFKIWLRSSQSIFKLLQEILSHIKLIKSFGKHVSATRLYSVNLIRNIKLNLANTKLETTGSFVNSLASRMILGLIIFYGGYQLIKGDLTLGSLTAITIYFVQLLFLQSAFVNFFYQLSLGTVSFERLGEILNSTADILETGDAKEVVFPKGRIEFKNITFGYNSSKKVFEDLTFYIDGGSCIALVGFSGCGKTTLASLILRLYKLNRGEILIDGYNIERIKSKLLYQQVSVAPQESYLWDDTIENNIKYGKEDARLNEIYKAAQIACIDDFVNSLPDRYNTVIGENACKISEGQKQRIAIARAVIRRPKILILDEALSSIDAETEDKIINNIRAKLSDTTLIVVSHHLSTIKKTDLVYFLEDCNKIDIDTHEDLLDRSVRYQNCLASRLKEQ